MTVDCQALAAQIAAETDEDEKARLQAQFDAECNLGGAHGSGPTSPPPPPPGG